MHGAAPRSHFYGTPLAKYQNYSHFVNILEDLTRDPLIAYDLSHLARKSVQVRPAAHHQLAQNQDLGRPELTKLANNDLYLSLCHVWLR